MYLKLHDINQGHHMSSEGMVWELTSISEGEDVPFIRVAYAGTRSEG